jgi:hypothetical protein
VNSIDDTLNEIYYGYKRNNFKISLYELVKSCDKLYMDLKIKKNTLNEIKHLILEEELRSKYLDYAKLHNIKYEDDDFDLFRQCNKHKNLMSLDGYITFTKCRNEGRECNEKVILWIDKINNIDKVNDVDKVNNVDKINNLNYEINGTCSCGHGEWVYMSPPDNLFEYNLNCENVYGKMIW